ncbi:MAG: trypsin-like peptidase domain-containing protein [Planctomycetaceae bacterium]
MAAAIQDMVPRITAATVQVDSGTDLSSGVMISENGYVLTVAHGLLPDQTRATLRLSGGTRKPATVVIQNRTADVAILKIADGLQQRYAFLPIAVEPTDIDAALIASGFPAREKSSSTSIVRLGRVVSRNGSLIRSSCLLTAGDSGGPLVNADGQLVGIHQRIGAGRDSNLHLPFSVCRDAVASTIDLSAHIHVQQASAMAKERVAVTPEVQKLRDKRVVAVLAADDQKSLALGTIVTGGAVVTKLSRVAIYSEIAVRTVDGIRIPATLIRQDVPLDLAVLKLSSRVESIEVPIGAESNSAGCLVFGDRAEDVGIISRTDHTEAASPPKLGCGLIQKDDRLLVDDVSPNSTAADLGLQVGDYISRLADQSVVRLDDVEQILLRLQPGDWVSATFVHSGKTKTGHAALRHPPSELLARAEFLDGNAGTLSERRTGFSHVLQHDVAVSAAHMGGPLFSLDGRLVAVNIARRSRESVLAVPFQTVQKIVNDALRDDATQ